MTNSIILSALYGIYFFIIGAIISYFSDAIFPPLKTYKKNSILIIEILAQIALLSVLSFFSMSYFKTRKTLFEYFGLADESFRSYIVQTSGNVIIPFAILLFQHRLNTKILHLKYEFNDFLIKKGLLDKSDRQKKYEEGEI